MMTVKTDIFLFTPWFPHLALFQRRQRKYQDGSDATVTLFQHPFHWDPSSCPGRGISCAMQSKAYHVIIFEIQYEEHYDMISILGSNDQSSCPRRSTGSAEKSGVQPFVQLWYASSIFVSISHCCI